MGILAFITQHIYPPHLHYVTGAFGRRDLGGYFGDSCRGSMQDFVNERRRTPLLGTWVNKRNLTAVLRSRKLTFGKENKEVPSCADSWKTRPSWAKSPPRRSNGIRRSAASLLNFRELRTGEVRRTPLPRRWLTRGSRKDRCSLGNPGPPVSSRLTRCLLISCQVH
jgi:hypothetical protein